MFLCNENKNASKECTFEKDFGDYAEIWKHHKGNYKFIIRITKNYIVFVNNYSDIDWETTDEYDTSFENVSKKTDHNKYISECQNFDQQPIEGLSSTSVISLKKIIGEAIVNCLEFNYEAAKKILIDAEKFRSDRLIEKSREWYLSFTILLTFIFILLFISLNYNNFGLINKENIEMLNAGAFAVIGACFSIIIRSGELCHASYAGKNLHLLEACSRLLGGFITSLIVFFGIKSGILFASVFKIENSNFLLPLLSILAGASERFMPSIITQIEKISLTESK